jgi:hypothetical protein
MEILILAIKGRYINCVERLHIHNIFEKGIQINEIDADHTNPICNILTQMPNT